MRSGSTTAAATSFQVFTGGSIRGKRVSFIHGVEFWNHPPEIQVGLFRSQIDRNLPNLFFTRRNPSLPVACSSSSDSQVELEIANEDETLTQLPDQDDSRMVQIRLQLRKECQFGEQFLVAGDHPELGLWNPLDAAPMVWSDGHVWTAELDLPAGELIQFKFVLREISGEFLWQPGPNRVLQTRETSKMIVVFGDWEKVAVRHVTKERKVDNQCEESNELMFREEERNDAAESNNAHIASFNGEAVDTVAESIAHHHEDSGYQRKARQVETNVEISSNVVVVAQRSNSQAVMEEVAVSNNSLKSSEVTLEIEGEIPILVPGLNPILITHTEEHVGATEDEIELNAFDNDRNSVVADYEPEFLDDNGQTQIQLDSKQEEVESYREVEEEEEVTTELIMHDKGHDQILLDPNREEVEGYRENEEEEEATTELIMYDRGQAQILLDPNQEEVKGYRQKEEEEATTELIMYDKVHAQMLLDPDQEEAEGYRENEAKEEEAAITEFIFDEEHSQMEYPNKPGFVTIDEPSQGLQLTHYVGPGSRNNGILHNYIRQGQETLRRFLNKLGFQ